MCYFAKDVFGHFRTKTADCPRPNLLTCLASLRCTLKWATTLGVVGVLLPIPPPPPFFSFFFFLFSFSCFTPPPPPPPPPRFFFLSFFLLFLSPYCFILQRCHSKTNKQTKKTYWSNKEVVHRVCLQVCQIDFVENGEYFSLDLKWVNGTHTVSLYLSAHGVTTPSLHHSPSPSTQLVISDHTALPIIQQRPETKP